MMAGFFHRRGRGDREFGKVEELVVVYLVLIETSDERRRFKEVVWNQICFSIDPFHSVDNIKHFLHRIDPIFLDSFFNGPTISMG